MSNNYRRNKAAIDGFRKFLKAEMQDISEIDAKILNQAVNEGLAETKQNTPVDTGFLQKSWHDTPLVKSASGVEKTVENNADYAIYVNNGHRIVSKSGETVGFVRGKFFLERGVNFTQKRLVEFFHEEVQRIGRKYE